MTDRPKPAAVAREISYASSAASRGGRAMIRVLENATGRLELIRRAEGYDAEVREGPRFLGGDGRTLRSGTARGGRQPRQHPREGPVVLIANHPYGILDGLMMGHILARARGDFRSSPTRVFRKAEDIEADHPADLLR